MYRAVIKQADFNFLGMQNLSSSVLLPFVLFCILSMYRISDEGIYCIPSKIASVGNDRRDILN